MILVAGEALIDLVDGADGRLAPHPGGGPYNAARTLARLGAPVALLTRLSDDGYGRRLRAELAADGVRPEALVATTDPTTLALVETDGDGHARYRFYAAGTSTAGLTVADGLRAARAASDAARTGATEPAPRAGGDPDAATAGGPNPVASDAHPPDGLTALHVGTLGLVFEPVAAAVEAVVVAAGRDVLVFCDPNCRPGAMPDEAAYRARLARVLARTHVVKVSDDDLAWLSPGVEPVIALRALLASGPAVGLLTRGAAGATIVTADATVAVPAPAVDVVDTIGAGDAFGGGFLAWLAHRGLGRAALADADAVRAATDYGVRVAAATCARAGASPPTRAELPD